MIGFICPLARGCANGLQRHALKVLAAQRHVLTPSAMPYASKAGDTGPSKDATGTNRGVMATPPDPSSGLPAPFDAAASSALPRVHQLIGDPRTGIADDTTTAPFGNVQVEWVWRQESNQVNWFRYTNVGDYFPHMYMDSRLSDHSKNLMYMLRAKDPDRWTIEALAAKFRIRRQRVLAILMHKELEAQAVASGKLLPGPLRPYAATVDLADVQLDAATGMPLDLKAVAQAVAKEQAAAAKAGRRRGKQKSADMVVPTPVSALGSLEDFMQQEEEPEAQQQQGPSSSSSSGSSSRSSSSSSGYDAERLTALDASGDLTVILPQTALTAQRLQLQMLQLLQRFDYSADSLKQHLLAELDKAKAYYSLHIAGTPLEQHLLAQNPSSSSSSSNSSSSNSHSSSSSRERDNAVVDAEEGGGDSNNESKPLWLDFDKQQQQIEALVEALRPLMESDALQQYSAVLVAAAQLKQLMSQVPVDALLSAAATRPLADSSPAQPTDTATTTATTSQTAESLDQEQQQQQQQPNASASQNDELRALAAFVESTDDTVLAQAFNQLELSQRSRLLELLPSVRVALNVTGVDLRAATSDAQYSGAAVQPYAAAGSSQGLVIPTWPGQMPPLVDVFGYQEVPGKLLDSIVNALPGMEAAARQLHSVQLGCSEGEKQGREEGGVVMSCEDLRGLRETLHTYQHVNWVYDRVLDEQAATAAGKNEPPALQPQQQRRLARILQDLDPHAIEKLYYWENWARKAAAHPGDARKLRSQIQKVLKHMEGQMGSSTPEPEFPDLPYTDTAHDYSTAPQRISHDVAAAYIDAEVAGRTFHRGSGEAHYVRLDTYPKFEGYTLEEFDAAQEGEYSALNRAVAAEEDELMWREFRERLMWNLGLAGVDLWDTRGHARAQRPKEGWDWVVHPLQTKKKTRGKSKQLQSAAAIQAQYAEDKQSGARHAPYVAKADGSYRPLNEAEVYMLLRQQPKKRKNWYFSGRYPGK
eukprot:jgi/Chrzof1/4844/Cz15g01100.t1